ncbi:MAG: hypothetical protein ACTSSG_11600 [Candidatus Heimdallarchaeaceae archaeon]
MRKIETFSLNWIGITFIVGTLVALIADRISTDSVWVNYLQGKMDEQTYNKISGTIFISILMIVFLVFVTTLFLFFIKKMKQNENFLLSKIGFISSTTSLAFFFITSILFIFYETKLYNFIFVPQLLNALISFSVFFFLSYLLAIIYLWKLLIVKSVDTKEAKIFNVSLIVQGLSSLLITLFFINEGSAIIFSMSINAYASFRFFYYLFYDIFLIFTVLAGATILLTKEA